MLLRMTVPAAAMLVLLGCANDSEKPAGPSAEQDAHVARSEAELGPVRVTVEVEPAEARLSDEPTLTLVIDYARGVTVRKPPFGESLGEFVIRDFREPLPRMEADREILEQIYTLEPTRTGELAIYPISVTFTDTRPDGDGKQYTVQTEGLTVKIASVLESDVPSLADLRPVAGPVELPRSEGPGAWWPVVLLAVAVCAGGAFAWWWRRRRRKTEEAQPLSPRELAYLELERLLQEDLPHRDVKLFYVELTAVVRRYIERTTGIHAPEQTTEEFLRQISGTPGFSPEESGRLKYFLESADLVKFAAHQPPTEDIEESFQRAKMFIGLEQLEVAA